MPVLQKKSDSPNAWQRLGPKRQQMVVIVSAFLLFVAIAYVFVPKDSPTAHRPENKSLKGLLTDADTRELGLTGLNHKLDETNETLRKQQQDLQDVRAKQQTGGSASAATTTPVPTAKADAKAQQEIQDLRKEMQQAIQQMQAAAHTPANPLRPDMVGMPRGPASAPSPARIRTIDSDAEERVGPSGGTMVPASMHTTAGGKDDRSAVPKKEDTVYVPSGTMVSGVLITGLDAPTGRSANSEPIPFLVRVKHEAILPNRFHADVRECFIVAAGYGDLASERAYGRAENLSCVRNDGKVIDVKIEGYLVGEDGKAGMRGQLFSKQGQAIAKAAFAGFAQAFAQALQPQYVTGGLGVQSGGVSGTTLEYGAAGGGTSALDRIAKYEIDLANQQFPVVEIDAGRPVTFVVLKGASLAIAGNK